ncbi:hypothetical protein BJ742DRAFT_808186 [Cladochytrium replicatum]|nr:hypothetical protein BJ742DRAFT_808186 [Cladochytrium replicatum]
MSYAKKVKSTVELATADLERRNKEFLQMEAEEIERSAKLNALAKRASLPWAGCVNEDQVREQILALSTDKRNLLMDIPDGAEFEFDLKTASPVAVAVLKIDKALDSLRFELVPKHIKDETFWRNYFYRVHLIKVSAQLSDATAKSPTLGTVVKTPADAKDEKESTSTSKIKSQISDTAKGNSPEICEGNADGDFEGEEDDEDWERQLQEELKDEE